MRYDSGHKEATRQKIIDVAARRFRSEGIEAVGVASVMADAGLTHGGFYAHFASKNDLVAAALDHAIASSGDVILKFADNNIEKFIRAYLSPAHRDKVDEGCTFAGLAAEIARHPDLARDTASQKIEPYIAAIGAMLHASNPASAWRRAVALFSLLMGSLQLARLTTDPILSDQILESGIKAALDLVTVFQGA